MGSSALHAVQRRYLAEDLVLKRRSDDHRRSGAARRGRIDPNPHQIDAVMFALSRLPEGGCILADEVGLGKTIEAGLVIAQRLAEGVKRVLLIVPTSLVPQWQTELDELFLIETRDGTSEPLGEAGTFLVSRDWAGSEQGSAKLREVEPFELCIIDEAHEIFAGIHKRFDKEGRYMPVAKEAVMAHRVHEAIRPPTPIVLLTATPIQNSLSELWGLVHYVEPTGTLLGNLSTFRQVFCDGDDRLLRSEQASELRDRLERVVKRTLRRDAQPFLEHPFVERRARLYEYEMTEEERSLYNDVTGYLLEPHLCAFPGSSRRLLLIGFHRRMASSSRALAASLRNVARRLERYLEAAKGHKPLPEDDFVQEEFGDLEGEGLDELGLTDSGAEAETDVAPASHHKSLSVERIQAELERVHGFSERAERLPYDSKAAALLQAVRATGELAERTGTSGKVVVFTESRVTQQYLRELLMKQGNLADEEITLFSSTNDSPRASQALERWQAEVGKFRAGSVKRQTAVRAALVHEFRERSRVFISTEAGAKGLNLQFCETLVNYDLPWNPQRIEQRIGRCHRYGQSHEVMVINFISKDNEAQRLTFDILSRKLDLFGTVLDASDEVLHEAGTSAPETLAGALGAGFEKSLSEIYERARTREELEREIRRLRDSTDAPKKRFQEELERTAGVIETQLHEKVRERFRSIQAALPEELAALDERMESLATAYLDAQGAAYEITEAAVPRANVAKGDSGPPSAKVETVRRVLVVAPSERLPPPLASGLQLSLRGARREDKVEALHPAHPLMLAAAADARAATERPGSVFIKVAAPSQTLRRGQRGKLVVERVSYKSFEDFERLLTVAVLEDETLLVGEEARALLDSPVTGRGAFDPPLDVSDELVEDALEEAMFLDQERVSGRIQEQFDRALAQLEHYVLDQILLLKRRRGTLTERIARAEEARDTAVGSTARTTAEESLKALEAELEEADGEYERLAERKDERFEEWNRKAHERRYAEPSRERLFRVEFELT
ncbi:MAG TPA: SNF2-related protein [Polyangiaceae bacterium]